MRRLGRAGRRVEGESEGLGLWMGCARVVLGRTHDIFIFAPFLDQRRAAQLLRVEGGQWEDSDR